MIDKHIWVLYAIKCTLSMNWFIVHYLTLVLHLVTITHFGKCDYNRHDWSCITKYTLRSRESCIGLKPEGGYLIKEILVSVFGFGSVFLGFGSVSAKKFRYRFRYRPKLKIRFRSYTTKMGLLLSSICPTKNHYKLRTQRHKIIENLEYWKKPPSDI